MLMFVFGAGASFDSDPERRPEASSAAHRPPLASGLFRPESGTGREVVARYPRAAPLIMRMRDAVRAGDDVEETLEAIADVEAYPELKPQLLAFRAYLTDLLWEVPRLWSSECQGLTNYVTLLDWADRWSTSVEPGSHRPVAFVSFNYDTLLEEAASSVCGHGFGNLDHYLTHPRIKIYKPHGSVNWQLQGRWRERTYFSGRPSSLRAVINRAADVEEFPGDEWRLQAPTVSVQDQQAAHLLWLPAISVPVRHKADFMMPADHLASMTETLSSVTTLVAVGWRGRERHFLRLLQEHMPSRPANLIIVSASHRDAADTLESLWETGRFGRYAIATGGFSGFMDRSSGRHSASDDPRDGALRLEHLDLAWESGLLWTNRQPGAGLRAAPIAAKIPVQRPML